MRRWLEQNFEAWGFFLRVIVKALILFALCNVIFALVYPMEILGHLSLYNHVFPGRLRFPYAQNASLAYNVTVNNIPAMFASHIIARPKAEDEFRVVVIGDSATWGWLLENNQTLVAQLNQRNLLLDDKHVLFYNLAYPFDSLTKDLLILDEAMQYEPDMIVWLVSIVAVLEERQYDVGLIRYNQARITHLVEGYGLDIDVRSPQFISDSFYRRTIIGQRRPLADLLRLQSYGLSWMATGIDQYIPPEFPQVRNDFDEDVAWNGYSEPTELSLDIFRFDILSTAIQRADPIPILIVNEPILIADGLNSNLHYNSASPRWVYDQYRALLAEAALDNDWNYIDLWDSIDAAEFTNSPLHYSPTGAIQLSSALYPDILEVAED